jgi:hypothetical protein
MPITTASRHSCRLYGAIQPMPGQRPKSPCCIQSCCRAPNADSIVHLSSASRDRRRCQEALPPPSPPSKAHRCSGSGNIPYHRPPAASMPQPAIPALSPEIVTPPKKKPRKWRNEVELLRDCDESSEIFLSPPPSRDSPPSPPPSSTLQSSQPTPPSDSPQPETPDLLCRY